MNQNGGVKVYILLTTKAGSLVKQQHRIFVVSKLRAIGLVCQANKKRHS